MPTVTSLVITGNDIVASLDDMQELQRAFPNATIDHDDLVEEEDAEGELNGDEDSDGDEESGDDEGDTDDEAEVEAN